MFYLQGFSQPIYNYTGGLNTITTSVPFLLIAPDARAAAMGDAGVASTPDANSIHWNPSKLAFIENRVGGSISYIPWWMHTLVPDMHLFYFSGYYKTTNNSVLAASVNYFSLGEITFTNATGVITKTFSPYEYAVDLAYSNKVSKNLSLGMTARFIYSNLTDGILVGGTTPSHAGKAIAADISGYYRDTISPNLQYALGMNISNIGNKISYTDSGQKNVIPTNLRLGGAISFDFDAYNSITFLFDANKLLVPTPPMIDSLGRIIAGKNPNVPVLKGMLQSFTDAPGGMREEFREINISAGAEYWFMKIIAVRGGIFYEDKTKGNRKYFSLGGGIKFQFIEFDIAYLKPFAINNPLRGTYHFSLLLNFGKASTN